MLIAVHPVFSMPGPSYSFYDAMLPWPSALTLLALSTCIYFLCQAGMMRATILGHRQLSGSARLEEMHDTLIQGVQGLMLSLQATASQLPDEGHGRAQIEGLLDDADNLLARGRQAMQDEQSAKLSGSDIEQALAGLALTLAASSQTHFCLSISGHGLPVAPDVRNAIYQLVRTAMINAVFHAHAQRVEVELCYAWNTLSLRIRDDGLGHTAKIVTTAHRHGYPGVQQMLAQVSTLQARLEIWSALRVGTELSLSLSSKAMPDTRLAVSRLNRVWCFLQKQLYQQ